MTEARTRPAVSSPRTASVTSGQETYPTARPSCGGRRPAGALRSPAPGHRSRNRRARLRAHCACTEKSLAAGHDGCRSRLADNGRHYQPWPWPATSSGPRCADLYITALCTSPRRLRHRGNLAGLLGSWTDHARTAAVPSAGEEASSPARRWAAPAAGEGRVDREAENSSNGSAAR